MEIIEDVVLEFFGGITIFFVSGGSEMGAENHPLASGCPLVLVRSCFCEASFHQLKQPSRLF